MNPGDQLAISLRLSDQTVTMNVDETVRRGNRHISLIRVYRCFSTRLNPYEEISLPVPSSQA